MQNQDVGSLVHYVLLIFSSGSLHIFYFSPYMEVAISMINTRVWFYGTNRKLMGNSFFGFQDVG
jgi:hypothetical protein